MKSTTMTTKHEQIIYFYNKCIIGTERKVHKLTSLIKTKQNKTHKNQQQEQNK